MYAKLRYANFVFLSITSYEIPRFAVNGLLHKTANNKNLMCSEKMRIQLNKRYRIIAKTGIYKLGIL